MNNIESVNIQEENIPETSSNSLYEVLMKELASVTDPETKLHRVIECMESSISQTGSPNFRSFWDARKVCLEIFKEPIAPSVRAQYWAKYSEISKEAYRLKEMLDEQSAFASEQIDMAIEAIEKGIAELALNIEKQDNLLFPEFSKFISRNYAEYNLLQREINLLNTLASRVNSLRKELIRTQMRVKQKNKFFKRLSSLGDKVFPRRKELIKLVSDLFSADMTAFVTTYFSKEMENGSLFDLREEIKGLQNIAKLLTLNSQSFSHSRKELSECWDKVKEVEKEKKREKTEFYHEMKQKEGEILQLIQKFGEEVAAGTVSYNDADKRIDEINSIIREARLGRDEVRNLKTEITKAEQPLIEQKQIEDNKRKEQEKERLRLRDEKLDNLRKNIADFEGEIPSIEASLITERFSALEKEIADADISAPHRLELRRRLIPIRDIVIEKVEKMRLEHSGEDLSELKSLIKDRKERRQKVKEQLEAYRKASGASGLGFEQMMKINEQIAEEKLRLEKLDQSIQELERKIS